jgi:hypothetical protein
MTGYHDYLIHTFPTSLEALPSFFSFQENWIQNVVNEFYRGVTYDTALPQGFFDECLRLTGFSPFGRMVWGYPPGVLYGLPLPIKLEGLILLQLMDAMKTIDYFKTSGFYSDSKK